jgi:hypothetical protein
VNTPGYLRNAQQISSQLAREDSAAGLLSQLEHTASAR